MDYLPDEVLMHIFFFCEGYNFLNRQICSDFRRMIPEINQLVYLDQLCKDGRRINFAPSEDLACRALEENLVHLLNANKAFIHKHSFTEAYKRGCLEVLKWAQKEGFEFDKQDAYYEAAKRGHFKVLQWLKANGYAWHKFTCAAATDYGDITILEWLVVNGCPWDREADYRVASEGRMYVINWARAKGYLKDKELYKRALSRAQERQSQNIPIEELFLQWK